MTNLITIQEKKMEFEVWKQYRWELFCARKFRYVLCYNWRYESWKASKWPRNDMSYFSILVSLSILIVCLIWISEKETNDKLMCIQYS